VTIQGLSVSVAETFRAQRSRLFGLAYRLTGSSEDAEDVVQQAFERLVLADYDERRCVPTPALHDRHRAALERLLDCLARGDAHGLESLLAEGVRTTTDHGGELSALRSELKGRDRVGRFYLAAARNRRAGGPRVEIVVVNGVPAARVTLSRPVRRQAPRLLFSFWDRIFGTFLPAHRGEHVAYGLDGHDGPAAQSTAGLLATPFRRP
jgi:hypothetical protein